MERRGKDERVSAHKEQLRECGVTTSPCVAIALVSTRYAMSEPTLFVGAADSDNRAMQKR